MQVWLKTKLHQEPNKRMKHLVAPPVNTTCRPFLGGGKWCMRIWSGISFWLSYSCCELLRKIKKKHVGLNLDWTCWSQKREKILHGYFIHSMWPPFVFVYWWQTEIRSISDTTSVSDQLLLPYGSVAAHSLRTVYLIVDCLSSNCFQRAATTSTLHPRLINAHSKAKVQCSSLTCPHCLPLWWGVRGV